MSGVLLQNLPQCKQVIKNLAKLRRLQNHLTPTATAYFSTHKPLSCAASKVRDPSLYPKIDPSLYDDVFQRSIKDPENFWAEQAEAITWYKKWDKVLDHSNPPFTKWFVGGELNVCYNAVDRDVEEGRGNSLAIIQDSPVTGVIKHITKAQLLYQVRHFAGVLVNHGVKKGDRVLIYMPMIPEAIIAMLSCARIGAMHSLVFGGFASKELATRINHAQPQVIVSANAGMEPNRVIEYKPLLDKAIELSEYKPKSVIIYNRQHEQFRNTTLIRGRDYEWMEEMDKAKPVDCVPVEANHPLYLLYTSGTTGIPKAVVRPSGGHAVMLKWSMWNLYGLKPGEVWFAASDLGWVVGHSYITYGPLLGSNTTIVYEGKPNTPDPGVYFRLLKEHNVAAMFVAPTALRALRRDDPDADYAKQYKLNAFRYLFVAGEHCDHETMEWSREVFQAPILDNWWQTETGSAITATAVGLGNTLFPPTGVAGRPVPGWDVKVIDDKMNTLENQEMSIGNIVVKEPLPPGSFSTLWQGEERFIDVYFKKFPGYYDTSDAGFSDKHGNIAVMARTDDVINVAGHRLSTGQLEEAILEHTEVAEAAVVAKPDTLKGHVPLGVVVLKSQVHHTEQKKLAGEICQAVRNHVGPVAAFKEVVFTHKLPKTRSGKIARNTIAAMVAGKAYKIPVTIEDPTVYPELIQVLRNAGYDALDPEEHKVDVYKH